MTGTRNMETESTGTEPQIKTISPFLYDTIGRAVLTRPLRWFFRYEITGTENWPDEGPALLASNHSSNLDPILVGIGFPGWIRWMAKSELWKVPILGFLLTRLGDFPVKRGVADRDAIRTAKALLRQGYVIGMFPEGTRQRDGRLGEPEAGVGLLAMEPGIKVIPVRVRGSEKIIRGRLLRRPKISVSVGPPVDLEISGLSRGRSYKEASRRIMAAIAEL